MEHSHPLGDDFARWVELTDDYEARLAHASPEEMPDRNGLASLARHLRELARSAATWNHKPGVAH
ncbi:Uncharacterised protein [Xylophilus ampelinus]|nr:Uncharacterised protein [Xylophilus ampelinus]